MKHCLEPKRRNDRTKRAQCCCFNSPATIRAANTRTWAANTRCTSIGSQSHQNLLHRPPDSEIQSCSGMYDLIRTLYSRTCVLRNFSACCLSAITWTPNSRLRVKPLALFFFFLFLIFLTFIFYLHGSSAHAKGEAGKGKGEPEGKGVWGATSSPSGM